MKNSIFTLAFLCMSALVWGQTATLQIIHNSADAAADSVDIYINGTRIYDDVKFRTATGFANVGAGTANVGVAAGNSTSVNDTIANFVVSLMANETYVVVADGIVSTSGYSPNQPFSLEIFAGAQQTAAADSVKVLVHHGSTDAPTVDVTADDTTTVLVDNASYTDFAGYLTLPDVDVNIILTNDDNSSVVERYNAPLGTLSLGGSAITVVASGFLNPTNNSSGPAFGLWVALPAGGALVELPRNTTSIYNVPAAVENLAAYPNPAADVVNLQWNQVTTNDVNAEVYNLRGQMVQGVNLGTMNEGTQMYSLNTADLANGTYMIVLRSQEGISTMKVQIQK